MNGNWRGFTSGNPLFHSCINYNSWYGVTFINAKSWMYFFWKNHWFLPLVKTKMWKSHIYRSTAECSCLKIRSYFLFLIMPKHHFSKEIKGRFFFKTPKKNLKKTGLLLLCLRYLQSYSALFSKILFATTLSAF